MVTLRAVIFDLDGLLFDTERAYMKATKAALADLGFDPDPEILVAMIGLSDQACDELLLSRLGPGFPLPSYTARYRSHRARLLKNGIPLRSGAAEAVDAMITLGLTAVAATNASSSIARSYLIEAQLLDRFSYLLCCEDAARPKPAPDIYLAAIQAVAASPHECLALEDSPTGIRAAHNAGVRVVAVADLAPLDREVTALCDGVAEDLFAVVRFVRGQVQNWTRGSA